MNRDAANTAYSPVSAATTTSPSVAPIRIGLGRDSIGGRAEATKQPAAIQIESASTITCRGVLDTSTSTPVNRDANTGSADASSTPTTATIGNARARPRSRAPILRPVPAEGWGSSDSTEETASGGATTMDCNVAPTRRAAPEKRVPAGGVVFDVTASATTVPMATRSRAISQGLERIENHRPSATATARSTRPTRRRTWPVTTSPPQSATTARLAATPEARVCSARSTSTAVSTRQAPTSGTRAPVGASGGSAGTGG